MSPRLFALLVVSTYKQGMERTARILRVCRLEYVSDFESGDVPAFFPALRFRRVEICVQEKPARCQNHDCINMGIRESGLMVVISR